jgi:hypothetical protein
MNDVDRDGKWQCLIIHAHLGHYHVLIFRNYQKQCFSDPFKLADFAASMTSADGEDLQRVLSSLVSFFEPHEQQIIRSDQCRPIKNYLFRVLLHWIPCSMEIQSERKNQIFEH